MADRARSESPRTIILRTFGSNVRHHRRAAEMTQEDLAEQSGINRSVIGLIERGEREVGVTRALLLAQALGTSLDLLLTPAPGREP